MYCTTIFKLRHFASKRSQLSGDVYSGVFVSARSSDVTNFVRSLVKRKLETTPKTHLIIYSIYRFRQLWYGQVTHIGHLRHLYMAPAQTVQRMLLYSSCGFCFIFLVKRARIDSLRNIAIKEARMFRENIGASSWWGKLEISLCFCSSSSLN